MAKRMQEQARYDAEQEMMQILQRKLETEEIRNSLSLKSML